MFIGHYEILAVTIKSVINPNVAEVSKNGRRKADPDKKKKSFVLKHHYIYMRDGRTGLTWKFTGSNRDGLQFSDARNDVVDCGGKPRRMKPEALLLELERLIGVRAVEVFALMLSNEQKGSEVRPELQEWEDTIALQTKRVKDNRAHYKVLGK